VFLDLIVHSSKKFQLLHLFRDFGHDLFVIHPLNVLDLFDLIVVVAVEERGVRQIGGTRLGGQIEDVPISEFVLSDKDLFVLFVQIRDDQISAAQRRLFLELS
jgi:hypothetical protein